MSPSMARHHKFCFRVASRVASLKLQEKMLSASLFQLRADSAAKHVVMRRQQKLGNSHNLAKAVHNGLESSSALNSYLHGLVDARKDLPRHQSAILFVVFAIFQMAFR